ncbi:hypothetical protein CEXT_795691 [Caerostris extrusa]|uniref:Uncharacterized protein n=1 Tax=Caerostris extrusa TaxID=172846 RepID=A0AAV4X9G2_CAEEX|nr:hypothetical protein CEXT_795691 [Caerostris extrusa]
MFSFFLKHKSDVVSSPQSCFLAQVENLGYSIKEILSGSGGESNNQEVRKEFCKKESELFKTHTCMRTSDPNRSCRHAVIRTIVKVAYILSNTFQSGGFHRFFNTKAFQESCLHP